MSFFKGLRDFLDLHKRERRGLLVLSVLMCFFLSLLTAMPYLVEPDYVDPIALEETLAKFKNAQLNSKEASNSKLESSSKPHAERQMFNFDPNTTSAGEWEKLGLNRGQVKSINKYLDKGGRFKTKSDLSKMYVISKEQYQELEPYIKIEQFPSKESLNSETTMDSKVELLETRVPIKEQLSVNLNTADTIELKRLKGIGSYFASKIVSYRSELGGFVSKAQLMEIWNFKEETYNSILNEIYLDSTKVQKIEINLCNVDELKKHPYIKWKEARAIIAYREQHGKFSSLDEITESHLITKELCQKIKPYLTLE